MLVLFEPIRSSWQDYLHWTANYLSIPLRMQLLCYNIDILLLCCLILTFTYYFVLYVMYFQNLKIHIYDFLPLFTLCTSHMFFMTSFSSFLISYFVFLISHFSKCLCFMKQILSPCLMCWLISFIFLRTLLVWFMYFAISQILSLIRYFSSIRTDQLPLARLSALNS